MRHSSAIKARGLHPRLWLWLVLAMLGTGLAQAQADPPGRVGRLAAVQGEVWVYEPEPGEWVAALPNRPFTGGDRLATGNGSSVELRIGSTTLLLGSQAELEALRLDDERMQFRLLRGPLGLLLRSDEVATELELLHPEARFLPRRAGLYRIDRLEGLSEATVTRGELRIDAHNLAMTLYPGQRAAFWRDGALGDTRSQWLGPQLDDFALALQTMEQADARSASAMYVPPEMTGVEDLDRHGRWQQHPEFGAVWSPSVIAVEWAPYRYGQWVWLRPWGWTWVDDAPWGFAPFHYGRWLWWGNRWCWAPGPKVPRPAFAPALVGWVGAPHYGAVSGGRPVPATGWLPLGPRDPYRPPYGATAGHLKRLNPHLPPGSLPPAAYVNRGVPGAVTLWPASSLASRQPVGAAAQRADELARQRSWQSEDFQHNAPARPQFPTRDQAAPRWAATPGDLGSTSPPGRPRPPVAVPNPGAPAAPAAPTAPVAPGAHGAPAVPVTPAMPGMPGIAAGRVPPVNAAVPPAPSGQGPFFGRPAPAAGAATRPPPLQPVPVPAAVAPAAPLHMPHTPRPAPAQPAPVATALPVVPAAPVAPAAPMAAPPAAPPAPMPPMPPMAPPRAHPAAPGPAAAPPAAAPKPTPPPVRVDADDSRNARQGADPGERRRTPDSRYTPRER
jgi:hypothetical protein